MSEHNSVSREPDESIMKLSFQADGLLPNNPELPVLLYKGVLRDHPEDTEQIFNANGWLNSWVNGVFPTTIITATRMKCWA